MRFLAVVLLFVLATCAGAATTRTSIIDPGEGGSQDYASLLLWESDLARDLTAADTLEIAECMTSDGSADGGMTMTTSWVTDATRYVKIWTNPDSTYRHNGVWDATKYRIVGAAVYNGILRLDSNYVYVIGLQIHNTSTDRGRGISFNGSYTNGGNKHVISHNIIRGEANANASYYYTAGIGGLNGDNDYHRMDVFNNIVYDFTGQSGSNYGMGIAVTAWSGLNYIENNTVYGCDRGIAVQYASGTRNSYNNLVQDCNNECFNGSWSNASYNCSDDSTEPGTSGQDGEVLFVDEANDDFRLSVEDVVAYGNGSDVGSVGVTDDIHGVTRANWDIGADEAPYVMTSFIDPASSPAAWSTHASLTLWESDVASDLTAYPDTVKVAECMTSDGTADGTQCTLSASWESDKGRYPKIWCNPDSTYRHSGVYDATKYRHAPGTAARCITTNYGGADYVRVEGIQFVSGNNTQYMIYNAADGEFYLEGCLLIGDADNTTAENYAFIATNSNTEVYVSNCIAYDFLNTGGTGFYSYRGTVYFYNNTAQNCTRGFRESALTTNTIKNCLAQDCDSSGFSGTWDTASHNCSDDSTEPGTSGQDGEVLFVDEANDDFRLSVEDVVAYGNGTDLSGDGSYPIDDDIHGVTRANWDIGADEAPFVLVDIIDPGEAVWSDFASLELWDSDRGSDLTTYPDTVKVAECITSDGSADVDGLVMTTSWVSDKARFIKIWTNPDSTYRHSGVWDATKYRVVQSKSANGVIRIDSDYVSVIGLQVHNTSDYRGAGILFLNNFTAGDNNHIVSHNIVRGTYSTSDYYMAGIGGALGGNHDLRVEVFNNIIYGFTGLAGTYYGAGINASAYHGLTYIENNTVYGCDRGINIIYSGTTQNCYNNLVQDVNDDCFGGTWSNASHNCSDDGTEPGTSGQEGNVLFVAEGSDNFHLDPTDTVALDNGSDVGGIGVTDDIDGDTRTGTWDIGADDEAYVPAAGGDTYATWKRLRGGVWFGDGDKQREIP